MFRELRAVRFQRTVREEVLLMDKEDHEDGLELSAYYYDEYIPDYKYPHDDDYDDFDYEAGLRDYLGLRDRELYGS